MTTDKTWCWIPNCDARRQPHFHAENAGQRFGSDTESIGPLSAGIAENHARRFAYMWNGDYHLTLDEQVLLEDEVRWMLLRFLNEQRFFTQGNIP